MATEERKSTGDLDLFESVSNIDSRLSDLELFESVKREFMEKVLIRTPAAKEVLSEENFRACVEYFFVYAVGDPSQALFSTIKFLEKNKLDSLRALRNKHIEKDFSLAKQWLKIFVTLYAIRDSLRSTHETIQGSDERNATEYSRFCAAADIAKDFISKYKCDEVYLCGALDIIAATGQFKVSMHGYLCSGTSLNAFSSHQWNQKSCNFYKRLYLQGIMNASVSLASAGDFIILACVLVCRDGIMQILCNSQIRQSSVVRPWLLDCLGSGVVDAVPEMCLDSIAIARIYWNLDAQLVLVLPCYPHDKRDEVVSVIRRQQDSLIYELQKQYSSTRRSADSSVGKENGNAVAFKKRKDIVFDNIGGSAGSTMVAVASTAVAISHQCGVANHPMSHSVPIPVDSTWQSSTQHHHQVDISVRVNASAPTNNDSNTIGSEHHLGAAHINTASLQNTAASVAAHTSDPSHAGGSVDPAYGGSSIHPVPHTGVVVGTHMSWLVAVGKLSSIALFCGLPFVVVGVGFATLEFLRHRPKGGRNKF